MSEYKLYRFHNERHTYISQLSIFTSLEMLSNNRSRLIKSLIVERRIFKLKPKLKRSKHTCIRLVKPNENFTI